MTKNKQISAIVIGSKSVNATGLIRSLGEAGISVTFMSSYGKIESKYTTEYVKLPENHSLWVTEIIHYCENFAEKPVLFPTDDDTAFLLDENCDRLSEYCFVPNAKGRMKKLADKTVMAEMAQNCGLNVAPFYKTVLNADSVSRLGFPVIIKPYAAHAGSKGEIRICNNEDDFKASVDELISHNCNEVMIQKFLQFEDKYEVGVMGIVTSNGEVVIPGIIHKIRSWPSDRGSTSYAQFQQSDPAVDVDALKEFVKSTGYTGIFDIELIISGLKAWFIEINFRNGQYGYLPTAAGYNLPYNYFKSVFEEKTDNIETINPVYYINERDDYLHVKAGNISKAEWKRQFKNATACGVYCKSDMRPFIRQYVKIPDRVIIKVKKIFALFKELIIKEEWSVAFRKSGQALLFEKNGTDDEFIVLKNSLRYWAADPFVFSYQGRDFIFFEMFDRFKSKGLIGYREITGGKVSKMKIAFEAERHLSFPFIYEKDGGVYIMPEYSEGRCLPLYRSTSFPDKWEMVDKVMDDIRLVDSSFAEYNGTQYLFTQELTRGYDSDGSSVYINNNNEWQAHKGNPLVKDSAVSRLGGRIIEKNGNLIRVCQDCSEAYGTQLHFQQIDELSEIDYSEHNICNIDTGKINLGKKKNAYKGIHTYNYNNNYEVIDLKNKDRVKAGNIINLFYRVFSKLK